MEHHIHGTDPQHGLIRVKPREHRGRVMLFVLCFHEISAVILRNVSRRRTDKSRRAHRRIAYHIVKVRLHQFDHHLNDMSWRAELTVGTALRNLRKQILIHVAHDVLVVEVKAVQCINHTHKHPRRRHKEQGIFHILGESRVPACVKVFLDERKHLFGHVPEHCLSFKVSELVPAADLMLIVKYRVNDRHIKSRRIRFLFQFIIVKYLNKHEICDLFNDSQRIRHTARPENIPDTVNFVFQFTSYHCEAPFRIDR